MNLQRYAVYCNTLEPHYHALVCHCVYIFKWCTRGQVDESVTLRTEWRRPIGCLKLQVIFRKRATNYRALLRKVTCKDEASNGSSPPCSVLQNIRGTLPCSSISLCICTHTCALSATAWRQRTAGATYRDTQTHTHSHAISHSLKVNDSTRHTHKKALSLSHSHTRTHTHH